MKKLLLGLVVLSSFMPGQAIQLPSLTTEDQYKIAGLGCIFFGIMAFLEARDNQNLYLDKKRASDAKEMANNQMPWAQQQMYFNKKYMKSGYLTSYTLFSLGLASIFWFGNKRI